MNTSITYPPIFKNELLEEQLNTKGYVVFTLFTAQEIDSLKTVLEKYKDFHRDVFCSSIWSENKECREEINALLKPLMADKLQEFLVPFQIVFCNLIIKKSSPNGDLDIHRDWRLVDEDKYRTLNIWCPLQDVNEENACLRVIEGSHLFPTYPRGRNVFNPIQVIAKEMNTKYGTPVPMRAGECILFNTQMYHCSESNISANDRMAFSTIITYPNLSIYHFVGDRDNDKLAKRLTVLPDFFVHYHYHKIDFSETDEYVVAVSNEYFTVSEIKQTEFDSFMRGPVVTS